MTLTEQLKELADGSIKRHPGEAQEIMKSAISQLIATSILDKAYRTGNVLPKIALPNAMGKIVDVNEIVSNNKVVLAFYRGVWCPYCNMELRALQKALPKIEEKGAVLIAISPQTPDNTLTTIEKNELSFEVLSDTNNTIASRMNLTYRLPEELIKLYRTFNIHLDKSNGNENQELPIAATYIIERDGMISYYFLQEDYKLRADPEAILAVL